MSQLPRKKSVLDRAEETLIAALLGLMTVITFANVIARYIFNTNILWALETTVFLFAWLVLLGASHAVKTRSHLGVDAVINAVGPGPRRILALISAMICIVFAFLLFKGAWDYWANFANLPGTKGHWFPLGFEEKFRPKGWYEVNDIPMPDWLRFIEGPMNDGAAYEKIPRFIPYAALPISMALLLLRFLQAAWAVWQGQVDSLIASHEAEDAVAELDAQGEG